MSNGAVKAGSELGKAYSSTEIAARFHEFGGIFRHVLPCDMDALTLCRTSQINAIRHAINSNTYKPDDIEIGQMSHYLSKYAVKEVGESIKHKLPAFNFKAVVYDYVSAHVKEELTAPIEIPNIVDMLIRNDETGFNQDRCPKQFERLVCCYLRKFGYWYVEGEPPCMADMAENTLYYSTNIGFPAVEMVLKRADGKVVGFQATRNKSSFKVVKVSALLDLCKRLVCQPKDLEICLVLAAGKNSSSRHRFVGEAKALKKATKATAIAVGVDAIQSKVMCREWILAEKYSYEPTEIEDAIGPEP